MGRKPTPTEKRVTLSGVSWQQLETLLEELGTSRTARLTYDRGKLEMMTPLEEHDRCARLIESLILVIADEMRVKVNSIGSVFLVRPDIGRGIQPDSCYYIDESVRLGKRAELDMNQSPPPNIAIEVSIGRGQLDRFSLYGSMDVPELWCYVTVVGDDVLKGNLQIFQLQNDRYVETSNSAAFPFLTAKRVLEFLEQSDTIGLAQSLIVLREWIGEHL